MKVVLTRNPFDIGIAQSGCFVRTEATSMKCETTLMLLSAKETKETSSGCHYADVIMDVNMFHRNLKTV